MKPSDFKKIDGFEEAIEKLKKGICYKLNCEDCPFSFHNAINSCNCKMNNYVEEIIVSAIEFEKMVKGDIMTKSDLVIGKRVVKTRDGRLYLVLESDLVGLNQYMGDNLNSHNENLELRDKGYNSNVSALDIIEVFTIDYGFKLMNLKNEIGLKSVWKRPEKSPAQIKLAELEAKSNEIAKEQKELTDKIKQLREDI